MAKRFAEQHLDFPHYRSNYQPNPFLKNPYHQMDNSDLCAALPHNSPSWVAYMDEPELSCVPGLDEDGGYIIIRTGNNTKIDTEQVCQNIASDPKDQEACLKKLNRGMRPGLDGYNGEVTVYLDDSGYFSFRQDSLFTYATKYSVNNLANAIGSAQYTQRTPDMTAHRIITTVKENPIIGDLSIGVIVIAVIATIANIAYSSIKSKIARRIRPKAYEDKEDIYLSATGKQSTKNLSVHKHPPTDDYDTKYFIPTTPKHVKNGRPVND